MNCGRLPTTESTFTKASLALPGAVALAAVVLTAAANGAYFPQEWGWPALAFALLAIVTVLVRDRIALGRLQLAFLAALAGFALWTLLSILWAPSATEPMLSFERTLVYVLFALALCLLGTSYVLSGVLAAATIVGVWSLLTRGGDDQLAGPIGYWNGLGALTAIGIVLAVGLRRWWSLAALAVLLPTLYLTYSRGSWLALACGLAVYVALGPVPRRAQRAFAVVAVIGVLAFVVHEGGPRAIWSSFTAPLPSTGGDLSQRLGSVSSNGRTEYWRVAWKETEAHPLLGGGAGTYVQWWHRLRHTRFEAQNAHSLYLETLAELGPVGLLLLLAFVAIPFVGRASPVAVAGWSVFVVHAALDWDWQLPAVTLAALACAVAALPPGDPRPLAHRGRWLAGLAPLAVFAIVIQVGNSALAKSETVGDEAEAARLARRAHTWAPWSAQPWQALGNAQLAAGDEAAARRSFRHAIRLDPADWSLWADLAQVDPSASNEAHRLNPYK
jgi:O-antigen ligase